MSIYKEIQRFEEIKRIVNQQEYQIDRDFGVKNFEKDSMDETKIICRVIRGKFRYYISQKYISQKKCQKQLRKVALAEYHKKLLPVIENLITCLKNAFAIEKELTDVYTQMHEGKRVLFEPEIVPVSMLIEKFENETYEGLSFDENDHTEYYTNRGERVRSKSEKIIADELDRKQVPYKYEKPLQLIVEGKQKEFHPDFTTMNKNTGKIIYLEHLGMMDNPYYYNNTLNKLDVYEKNGLLIGRDVLLFHESARQPLNTRIISNYINEFLI